MMYGDEYLPNFSPQYGESSLGGYSELSIQQGLRLSSGLAVHIAPSSSPGMFEKSDPDIHEFCWVRGRCR